MRKLLPFMIVLVFTLLFPVAWDGWGYPLRLAGVAMLIIWVILWLLFWLRSKRPFFIPKPVLPLGGFILLQWASLLFISPVPDYGRYGALLSLVALLFLLFVSDTARSGWKNRVWENALLSIALVLTLLDLFAAAKFYGSWWKLVGTIFSLPPVSLRLTGTFLGHPNTLAGFLNLVIPIVLLRLIRARRSGRRLVWASILLLFLVGQFLTSSRTGWLALAAGLVVTSCLLYLPVVKRFLSGSGRKARLRPQPVLSRGMVWSVGGLVLVAAVAVPLVAFQVGTVGHGSFSDRWSIYRFAGEQFLTSPIIGHGTGSLPFLFAGRAEAMGVDEVFHAHNLWLHLGAEYGVLGLALIVGMLVWVGKAFVVGWRATPARSPQRDMLVAYAGALTAVFVHHFLDLLFGRLLYTTGVLLILALLLRRTPRGEHWAIRPAPATLLFAGLALVSAVWTVQVLPPEKLYWEGWTAAQTGDWQMVREKTCEAAERARTDGFFDFQCSLANAMLAAEADEPGALSAALVLQRRGLEHDPSWYVHWANLGVLEWQQGQRDLALEHLEQAVAAAPYVPFFRVQLAWMQEQVGQLAQAQENYHLAVCLDPWLQESILLSDAPERRAKFGEPCPAEFDRYADRPAEQKLWEGWQAMQQGDVKLAEQTFREALELKPGLGGAQDGLARIAQKQGDLEAAREHLRFARFVDCCSNRARLTSAEQALSEGREAEAMELLSKVFDNLRSSGYSQEYYAQTYRREALQYDLLLYYINPYLTPEIELRLVQLAEFEQRQGNAARSEQILKWLGR